MCYAYTLDQRKIMRICTYVCMLEIELNCPRWIDRILRSQVNEGMKRDTVKLKYGIAAIA